MATFEAPIALRYWPHSPRVDRDQQATGKGGKRKLVGRDAPYGGRVLVICAKTRLGQGQCLPFGLFRVYVNGRCESEGAFAVENLPDPDLSEIKAFSESYGLHVQTREKVEGQGDDRSPQWATVERTGAEAVLTLEEFLWKVFYPESKDLGALCIGFDLPFALSCMAEKCSPCDGENRDAFSLKMSWSFYHPRIRIKPLGQHACSIRFTGAKQSKKGSRRKFQGRFLDLHTLAYALTGEAHSLVSAGKAFGVEEEFSGQGLVEERGEPITEEYLRLVRQDVTAAYYLYLQMGEVYDRFPFATHAPEAKRAREDTWITELYSPASIAKACLRKVGVSPFLRQNPGFPPEYLGYAMSAYCGGRSECRTRKLLLPATLVDFTSQYPACFTLLGLWAWVIAERLEIAHNVEQAQALLERIAAEPELLFDPLLWPKLAGYAKIIRGDESLPTLAPWGRGSQGLSGERALSVCQAPCWQPLWYGLPDLATAAATTGKAPRLLDAFTVEPVGTQEGLQPIGLGGVEIDPRDPGFFVNLITLRKRLQSEGDSSLAEGVKLAANSGCYGVFAEFRDDLFPNKKERREVACYSNATFQARFQGHMEMPGTFTNPLIAALVTAAGRLLLGMLCREVEARHGTWLWLATDAMAIATGEGGYLVEEVSRESAGGQVSSLSGIRSLAAEDVRSIQAQFQRLSPYPVKAVPEFLKVEAKGFGYSVSSMRHCLLGEDGTFAKSSAHGLSAVIPPDGLTAGEFAERLWLAVLTGQAPEEWLSTPLRREIPIRQVSTWLQAQGVAQNGGQHLAIRPFTRLQTASPGSAALLAGYPGHDRREFRAPYVPGWEASKALLWWDSRTGSPVSVTDPLFTDGCEGLRVRDEQGRIPLLSVAGYCSVWGSHPERKMSGGAQGNVGLLAPRRIAASGIRYVGKETEAATGEKRKSEAAFDHSKRGHKARQRPSRSLAESKAKLAQWPGAEIAGAVGINRSYLWKILTGNRVASPEVEAQIVALAALLPDALPLDRAARRAAVLKAVSDAGEQARG